MEEDIISFETAKLFHEVFPDARETSDYRVSQSLAEKYIRVKHSIYIDIQTLTNPNEILGFVVRLKSWQFPPELVEEYLSRPEALEEGLKAALNKLKSVD